MGQGSFWRSFLEVEAGNRGGSRKGYIGWEQGRIVGLLVELVEGWENILWQLSEAQRVPQLK